MTTANCPTCGGPIEFKVGSSFLVVCPHCRSAIARTDRELKDLGKVAALVDTESPLAVGLAGKYYGHDFRLTGRTQLRHSLGGVWDEWYAAFADGRWGWLAEAQGRFYMTFEAPLNDAPKLDDLQIGAPAPHVPAELVVAEKGSAEYASAEGEIPYPLRPGKECVYADLSGQKGLFATLDFSDGFPVFYAGREVTLAELSLDAGGAQRKEEKRAPITNLSCPNCGGSLELRAPDETERVGCPYCGALLDASQGKFSILQALKEKFAKPLIPLGAVAEFERVKQTVIGYFHRSCVVEGTKYFWQEYLLYHPQNGFRWLVRSDGHWTYVKPIGVAEVKLTGRDAVYHGTRFKRFQDAPASVELVLGECYWKVTLGEKVQTADFVAAPLMLSSEQMIYEGKKGGEINWSLGEYVPVEDIRRKFNLPQIPEPSIVGACQPNPHQSLFGQWAYAISAAIILALVLVIAKPSHASFVSDYTLEAQPAQPAGTAPAESGKVVLTDPFTLNAREMIKIEATSPLDNSWLALAGDLINTETDEVAPFDLNLEYYYGVEDGERWTEGAQSNYVFLAAVPAGTYQLRLEAQWEHMDKPSSVHVDVTQSSSRWLHVLLLLGGISILPTYIWIRKLSFETNRWKESMYGGGGD